MSLRTSTLFLALAASTLPAVHSFINYANDFVNPDYILAGNFGNTTIPAQNTIKQWADDSATGGPWSMCSVMPCFEKH